MLPKVLQFYREEVVLATKLEIPIGVNSYSRNSASVYFLHICIHSSGDYTELAASITTLLMVCHRSKYSRYFVDKEESKKGTENAIDGAMFPLSLINSPLVCLIHNERTKLVNKIRGGEKI